MHPISLWLPSNGIQRFFTDKKVLLSQKLMLCGRAGAGLRRVVLWRIRWIPAVRWSGWVDGDPGHPRVPMYPAHPSDGPSRPGWCIVLPPVCRDRVEIATTAVPGSGPGRGHTFSHHTGLSQHQHWSQCQPAYSQRHSSTELRVGLST